MLDDDTIFLSLGRRFSFFIVNRLIMDNLWAIIDKYITFLIGGDLVFSPNTDFMGCQPFKGDWWRLSVFPNSDSLGCQPFKGAS